jgi:hypothetical protein
MEVLDDMNKRNYGLSRTKKMRTANELLEDAYNDSLGFGCLFTILMLAIYALVSSVFAFALMLVWNYVMPYIFHLPVIDFWQAYGLMWLINLFTYGIRSALSSKV